MAEDKKQLLIVGGVAAIGGLGFLIYRSRKNAANSSSVASAGAVTAMSTPVPVVTSSQTFASVPATINVGQVGGPTVGNYSATANTNVLVPATSFNLTSVG